MNSFGILATLHARPGKEVEVAAFLQAARLLVEAETGTTSWYSFRSGPETFGIFDTFETEEGRGAHINGEVARTLFARAKELFVSPPKIEAIDIISEKAHVPNADPIRLQ